MEGDETGCSLKRTKELGSLKTNIYTPWLVIHLADTAMFDILMKMIIKIAK